MASTLSDEFSSKGFRVPTAHAANWMIRFAGCFDGTAAAVVPRLGLHELHDHTLAETVLGIKWRDAEPAFVQLAGTAASFGIIKAPSGFEFAADLGEVRTEGMLASSVEA